ncbi:CD225/dispanin family protein, partial [Isoptericola sp. NPDC019482]|uniref:CD225/dispanin family protein n=1 Tax=Isoptericola sp. NPDC019482 TaxID=3154688 RepID=UPI0034955E3F
MAEPARVPAAGSRAGTAWAIVAMVFFWPLAIGAVLASVRASRARGAGDDAVAAEQVRHVRALGIAAVVTGVVVRLVGVAVLVGAVSLADRAPVLLAAFADAAPVRDAPARPVLPTSVSLRLAGPGLAGEDDVGRPALVVTPATYG